MCFLLCTLELKNLWRIITQKAFKRIFVLLNNLPIDEGFVDNHHIFTYRNWRGTSLNNVSCIFIMSKVRNTCSCVLGVGGSREETRWQPSAAPPPTSTAVSRQPKVSQSEASSARPQPITARGVTVREQQVLQKLSCCMKEKKYTENKTHYLLRLRTALMIFLIMLHNI